MINRFLTEKTKNIILLLVSSWVGMKIGAFMGSPQVLPHVGIFIVAFIFWYGFFELAKK
jgi:hypothetical protein